MTRVSKQKRGNRGAKRLDLTDIREALKDGRVWTALGVVVQPADGSPHWEIVDNADVMVEVELQPDRVPAFCRLAAGMWIVPTVGEEVAVLIPAGEIEFSPTILCILASVVPGTQGPTPDRIVIARSEVVIHDGSGGASALALKSDVSDLRGHYIAHTHATAGGTGTPSPPATAATAPTPTGTTVLKAK